MENQDDFTVLLSHIGNLKEVCEKLKLDLRLLEIPIAQANSRVLPLKPLLRRQYESLDSSYSSLDSSLNDTDN